MLMIDRGGRFWQSAPDGFAVCCALWAYLCSEPIAGCSRQHRICWSSVNLSQMCLQNWTCKMKRTPKQHLLRGWKVRKAKFLSLQLLVMNTWTPLTFFFELERISMQRISGGFSGTHWIWIASCHNSDDDKLEVLQNTTSRIFGDGRWKYVQPFAQSRC